MGDLKPLVSPATDADIEIIKEDTEKIYNASFGVSPADGSLASFISTGGIALGTRLAANKSLMDIIGTAGNGAISHDYNENSLLGFMHGFHNESIILLVIPEAVASINTHNSDIQTALGTISEVITITQADALTYPDFQEISICVLGTNNGTAWTTANLAHIKTIPSLPILCCDATSAAYMEIGTDGGAAAAKTIINAVTNVKGSILGAGFQGITGLAVGANTIAVAGTTLDTLDMSNANITETWYAYESVNANTDVVLGLVQKTQPDGTTGVDETGAEVEASMAFYGAAYSFNELNTLGQSVLKLLALKLVYGQTVGSSLTIAGDIGDLEKKVLGNMKTKFSNATPLAKFIAGTNVGLGTVLPNSKSLYDVVVLDRLSGGEYTSTISAGTAAETTLKEIVTSTRVKIESIWLDLTLLVTAGATIKLYHKIDGTNYKVFETDAWALADDDGVLITGFTINNDFKITITGGEAAGVVIPYNIIYQVME